VRLKNSNFDASDVFSFQNFPNFNQKLILKLKKAFSSALHVALLVMQSRTHARNMLFWNWPKDTGNPIFLDHFV
jgi:hypothetical protein